ncbi:hypothetical protein HEP86_39540 [Streptomyces sp. RPA4-5]|uniref:hypothetical protein n=1 Tax=Streptomyces sp. RPA4-5 TaxID=2721245 RepID=UPI00143E7222|nr:hypothetical protein [Streptomyces sp. RPA4-5]QIY59429.1 hypothetical protein HEP86_39540 [Streptomyces sp. RPA4-5]
MTPLEEILSRALLVPDRVVPRDIVAHSDPGNDPDTRLDVASATTDAMPNAAAEDLRALCETLVMHTPATAITGFVTDQVPEPRSALILACVLQLTNTDGGARFWWQYAAGAGQAAAAYCLYLHHLSLGEDDTAQWWHHQTDDVQPPPPTDTPDHFTGASITSASTTTILRVLRHLSKHTNRPRTAAVTELMDYMPTAVAVGYLREPDVELPMPGPNFARRIRTLLTAAANRPDVPSRLPARAKSSTRARREAARDLRTEGCNWHMGETATR